MKLFFSYGSIFSIFNLMLKTFEPICANYFYFWADCYLGFLRPTWAHTAIMLRFSPRPGLLAHSCHYHAAQAPCVGVFTIAVRLSGAKHPNICSPRQTIGTRQVRSTVILSTNPNIAVLRTCCTPTSSSTNIRVLRTATQSNTDQIRVPIGLSLTAMVKTPTQGAWAAW